MPQPNVTAELTHEAAAGGATNAEGEWIPGAAPVPYAVVKGFYLDEGPELTAGREGQVPLLQADGQFFGGRKLVEKYGVKERDSIRMTYGNGDVVSGRVVQAVRATGILYLESV